MLKEFLTENKYLLYMKIMPRLKIYFELEVEKRKLANLLAQIYPYF